MWYKSALIIFCLALAACKQDGAPKEPNFAFQAAGAEDIRVALRLEIAADEKSRTRGLSRRRGLAPDAGMLFIFDSPGHYTMWMKDTYLRLDMIFLNDAKVVTYIAPDRAPLNEDLVSPCHVEFENTGLPAGEIAEFFNSCMDKYTFPYQLTRYVLEVPAGTAAAHGIQVGDVLVAK